MNDSWRAQKVTGQHGRFGELPLDGNEVELEPGTAEAYAARLAARIGGRPVDVGGGTLAVEKRFVDNSFVLISDGDYGLPFGGRTLVAFHADAEAEPQEMWLHDPTDAEMDCAVRSFADRAGRGRCDPDRLRADLAAADPDGNRLTPAQVDSLVHLSRVLDSQPTVDVERGDGPGRAYVVLGVGRSGNAVPGRVTRIGAMFVSRDATGPRRTDASSEWTLPGTDWSNSVSAEFEPGEFEPERAAATVKRIADIQVRCDEQVNRPAQAREQLGFDTTALWAQHRDGRDILMVDRQKMDMLQLTVTNGEFTEALVSTDWGVWKATGEQLRTVVLGSLAQQLWLDVNPGHRNHPEHPDELERRLLG